MTKVLGYIKEELGFQKIDVDFDGGTIGEGSGTDYLFINFKRGIVFKWASGYDPCCLIGKLTKSEEGAIYRKDMAEHHIEFEDKLKNGIEKNKV